MLLLFVTLSSFCNDHQQSCASQHSGGGDAVQQKVALVPILGRAAQHSKRTVLTANDCCAAIADNVPCAVGVHVLT